MNTPPMLQNQTFEAFKELTDISIFLPRIISLYFEKNGNLYEQKFEDDMIVLSAKKSNLKQRIDSYNNEDSVNGKQKILDSAILAVSGALSDLFQSSEHPVVDIQKARPGTSFC